MAPAIIPFGIGCGAVMYIPAIPKLWRPESMKWIIPLIPRRFPGRSAKWPFRLPNPGYTTATEVGKMFSGYIINPSIGWSVYRRGLTEGLGTGLRMKYLMPIGWITMCRQNIFGLFRMRKYHRFLRKFPGKKKGLRFRSGCSNWSLMNMTGRF